jgi:hypothetical protein
VKISNWFAALENLDVDDVDIRRAWESTIIRENVKASVTDSINYYELEQCKSWFDKACSKLSDQRKQAKLQWMQNPSQINGLTLNNVRHETRRTFRNKKMEYLKNN